MRVIGVFFLTLFSVFACAAQTENCLLKEAKDAPALFGLSLGISPAAARGVLGKDLKIKNKTGGEYTFFQNFIENRAPVSLPGVRAIYLRFFAGALYQIEIFYEDETRGGKTDARRLENFIDRQSAKLNLPPAAWQIKYGIAALNCGGFSLAADNFLNPRLELTDEAARAEVEAKRKKN